MNLDLFIKKLNSSPETIEFTDTMAIIDMLYSFTAIAFKNGKQVNAPNENSGSCKIFAFAGRNNLTEQQTLACFGAYYREEVLANSDGDDHQNIRNFMKTGWQGIEFAAEALEPK